MIPQLKILFENAIQAFREGNFEKASALLKDILQNDINDADIIYQLGISFADANGLSEAIVIFNCLQVYKKDDHRIAYNLGLMHSMQENHLLALEAYQLSLKIQPDDVETLINLGSTYNETKNYQAALEAFNRALALNTNYYEAWSNKGVTLSELKRYEEAIAHYDKAISIKPDYAECYSNKGNSLNELKRYEEAIAHYDKAISLKPDYAEAWSNKGVTLSELKRYEEAIAHYDKAISLKPDYAEAWSNKGITLNELKRYDEAIVHYDKAISIKPDYAECHSNKGNSLNELKRYDEAITCFKKAADLKPEIKWIFGQLVHAKMQISDWNGFQAGVEALIERISAGKKASLPFPVLSLVDSPSLHKKGTQIYADDKYSPKATLGAIVKRPVSQKIRIGYFSPDFRSHPVSYLTSELFELHDRSSFEIFAFSLQSASPDDPVRERLIRGFDHFIHVENKSDQEIAQLARDLEIDIAVDLAGYTQDSRMGIFAHRASPIQISYLGYPGTLGAPYIDYIVGDKTLIPEESRQFYTEKVVYLPNTYMVDDSQRQPSSCPITRKSANLPDDQFVFCCFNNSYKFNRETLTSWAFILLNVEKSVLWISENNEPFRKNLLLEFSKLGVASERIIFAKRMESMADHLSRYSLADLFLDTLPFNAHTTAVDSLKAGLPVLTLLGNAFAGRVAASLLTAIEMPELITTSRSEYQSLAVDLAKNPAKLIAIKEKLEKNKASTALFNTEMFTRHLEKAYLGVYGRYQADSPPDHITII